MITLHGDRLRLKILSTVSFPNGFECHTFADSGAESVRPVAREKNEHVAVHVPSNSPAAANFAALSPEQDDIAFTVTYPDGSPLELKNGIVSGTAKLDGNVQAFFFTFRAEGSIQKAIARHAKRKVKHTGAPANVTLH